MLKAGFAKVEITPQNAVPLAGYFGLRDRMHTHVLDTPFVRALSLSGIYGRAVILAFDLLLISDELYQNISRRLADRVDFLFIHATHTHSSLGGLGKTLITRLAFGSRLPWVNDFLAECAEKAVLAATTDEQPAHLGSATGRIPALAKNRRDPRGPVDPDLTLLRIVRKSDEIQIVNYAGHPVIVAERDPQAMSADFPGEICRRLEKNASFGMFLNGPLGGVDVYFPDRDISATENMEMEATPIVEEALRLKDQVRLADENPNFVTGRLQLPRINPDPFFENQRLARLLGFPLRVLAWLLLRSSAQPDAPISILRLGKAVLVGIPAEAGVHVTEPIKQHCRRLGLSHPMVCSNVNGYIGYVHHPKDYAVAPARETLGMAIYENSLNLYGRQTGQALVDCATTLIESVLPGPCV